MRPSRRSRSGSPLVPTTDTGALSSPAQPGGVVQSSSEVRAAFVRPASSAEDATRGPQVGDKRKHSDGSEEHLGTTGTSGQSLQIAENLSKGALTTCLALSWPRNASDLNTACRPRVAHIASGSREGRLEVQSALEQLARRIVLVPEGSFAPSPPPALLDSLTDELLVVASDTINAVVTEVQPLPSGKAQLRLLAWLVADARGASMLLDKAEAALAGKRLDYQAQRVRDSLAHATETAKVERAALAAQAQAGELDLDEIKQARAQIDREERRVYDFHRDEVYIGFHELEALLPRADAVAVAQPRFTEVMEQERRLQAQAQHRPLPSMPPDLAAVLDTDVCAELQSRFASANAWDYNDDPEAHVWWTQLLPDFVAELRAERDAARRECDALSRERDTAVAARDAAVAARDNADLARDAADAARDDAEAARNAAVDEALKWEWNVDRVQQSQQRRIELYCARIEELETERECMIESMIA